MAESRTLKFIIDAENRASKVIKEVNTRLETMQDRLKRMEPEFQGMATKGALAFGGISAGVGVSVKNASDLEESINAVNVVFGEGAKKILEFGEQAPKAVGLASSEFNQMSTQTGALLKDTGVPIEKVADMTIDLTKRASDMASVFNTDVGDAMSAINQALRGETEAIRRYAGDVTDATLETYALSQGINKSVTDMTQQEKRLLRVDLIMSQTSVTAGDFANTSDSLANRMRILKAQTKNISTTLGDIFIPMIQKVLNKVAPFIEKLGKWVEENPKLAKTIIIAIGAVAGLVAVIGVLGLILPTIIAGFGLLFSPITVIIGAIGGLIYITYKIISSWETFAQVVKFLWGELVDFFSGVLNDMILTVDNVMQRISEIWNKIWTGIGNFVKTKWGEIKTTVAIGWSWLKEKFTQMTEPITNAWNSMWEGLTNSVTTAWEGVKNTVKASINWIIRKVNSFINSVNRVASKASGAVGLDAPQIPTIPALAKGGIVNKPTLAMIGEAGPEAVVPLKKSGGFGNITINITGNEFLGEEGVAERIGEQIMQTLKNSRKLAT